LLGYASDEEVQAGVQAKKQTGDQSDASDDDFEPEVYIFWTIY